jgi:hypothetical protein
MTTLTLSNVATITLTDGRTIVLDGSSKPSTALKQAAKVPATKRAPKGRKAAKQLTPEAIAQQASFWSGKATEAQLARIKAAGGKRNNKTYATMTALEARAELGKLNPAAKLAVIPQAVLDAMQVATKK